MEPQTSMRSPWWEEKGGWVGVTYLIDKPSPYIYIHNIHIHKHKHVYIHKIRGGRVGKRVFLLQL